MPNYGGIGGGGGGGAVASVFARTGAVVAQTGDYTAAQVGAVPTSAEGVAGGVATLDGTANVPLSELGNAPSAPVSSVFTRTGAVTAQAGDYTAAQVSAVPTSAEGAAGGVATLDGTGNVPLAQLGHAPGGAVSSVFSRTGAVVANTGDYTAAQVSAVPTSAEGIAGGVATLDGTANVPLSQLGNAPSGTASGLFSAYLAWFNGTTYFIKNWFTGTVTYSSTSAATIATDLGTLLNGSTSGAPIVVIADASFNLSGQTWATHGNCWVISGYDGGQSSANPNSIPNLGTFTIGVATFTADITGILIENCTIETETFLDVGLVTDINHHNVQYRGVNVNTIVVSNTPAGGGGIQYLRWTGQTCFAISTTALTQDFFQVTGIASTASLGHSFFEYIQQVGCGAPTTNKFSMFHFVNGTKWHRLEVLGIDLNTNQASNTTEPTLIQFDGGSAGTITQCPAIYFGFVHWEQHQTTGTPSLVQCGNFTAGSIDASIFIDTLWVNTHTIALFTNGGGVFTGNGYFLDLRSITADVIPTTGTWAEDATCPIRIGPATCIGGPLGGYGVLNTGNIIATPKSSAGNILSLAGTGAFATATTYTCGGTSLGYRITGTVTLTSSDGTALITAGAVTNLVGVLTCGMKVLVAAGGSAQFWKHE